MSITFNQVPSNAAASGTFVEQQQVSRSVAAQIIPQRILLIGQYNAGLTPSTTAIQPVLSLSQAKSRYGRGSMLAILADYAFRTCGAVPVYAIAVEDDGGATAATGAITVTGTATSSGTLAIYIAGVKVAVGVAADDTASEIATAIAAAINAAADLPVTASVDTGTPTVVDLTCKWAGLTGNTVTLDENYLITESQFSPAGTTIAFSGATLSGGATDPDIGIALDAIGDDHYTVIVDPYGSSDTYDALRIKGDELSDAISKRIMLAVSGYTGTRANLLTLLGSRNSQWYSIVPVSGSLSMPLMVAASAAGASALSAQLDPGRPARTLELKGIRGASEAWSYTERNAVVLAGGSTTLTDMSGIVRIEDTVTTYTTDPDTSENDAWRFAETVFNLMNKVYQIDQTFKAEPFARSIVVDDASTTQKQYAIRPKVVKGYAVALVDNWIAQAWSRERDAIVAGITAEINATNAGRIDLVIPDVMAAGGKIYAIKLEWSFDVPSVN